MFLGKHLIKVVEFNSSTVCLKKYMAEMGFDIDNSRASTGPTLQRTTSSRAASRSEQGDHNVEH